jgi:hypothetical protein
LPVKGLSPDNYRQLGNAFIAQGIAAEVSGIPFLIVRDLDAIKRSDKKRDLINCQAKPTPDQWWAWRNFLSKLGYSTIFMDQKGYYTVPAEWPSQFALHAFALDTGILDASFHRPSKTWNWKDPLAEE